MDLNFDFEPVAACYSEPIGKIIFQKKSNENKDDFLVPDRISGIEALKELNPARKWNFVEINVKLDELR